MIPETNGHRVKVGRHTLPVIAWNDEGQPMVAGKHGLEAAKWVAGRVTGITTNYEVVGAPRGTTKGRATDAKMRD